jgi:hypothetical protein
MTREKKKIIRLRIIKLLDQCEGCHYRQKVHSSINVCPSCPIGQEIQALGEQLGGCRRVEQMKSYRHWTAQEEQFLLRNLHMKRRDFAEKLGRSHKSIKQKINDLRKRGLIHDAS